jgi:serine/threonine protein kinase
MKGGHVIGVGTQGCIVSPKLNRFTRNNGKILAKRSENSTKASKIFFDSHTFKRETRMMFKVAKATGGIGMMVYIKDDTNPIFTANALEKNDYNTISLVESPPAPPGCLYVKQALNANERVYIINQRKVLGDIRSLKRKKPLAFFADAYSGLLLLKKHRIRHRDMYARNIFYNEDGALIGDFGHAVDLNHLDHPMSHYPPTVFDTKEDLMQFINAIEKYVQEDIRELYDAIRENDFYKFYEIAGIETDTIPDTIREYLDTHPTDTKYTPPRRSASPKTTKHTRRRNRRRVF